MEAELDATAYQSMIDAILGAADLEKITIKKIRNALSELYSTDFTPHKKVMNDFILQRYYALADGLNESNEEPSDVDRKRKLEHDDRKLAEKLQSESYGRKTRGVGASKKPKRSKGGNGEKRAPNTAFNAELSLSSALQQVVGAPRMSRPMVVKRLWEYIKEHQLQDPEDKRRIFCDAKLQAIFKKTSVGMFEMNRLLGSHLAKEGDLVDGSTELKREPSPAPKSDLVSESDE